jgi:hypothetical protein
MKIFDQSDSIKKVKQAIVDIEAICIEFSQWGDECDPIVAVKAQASKQSLKALLEALHEFNKQCSVGR